MSDLPHILIIDDEIDLGEILGDYLEDDFECTICSNPVDGRELIKTNAYALIISDMHMPDVNGFDIIEAVKQHQPETPVIVLTGNSQNDPIVQEAMEKGAKGLITKPFNSPNEVLLYLKKFL